MTAGRALTYFLTAPRDVVRMELFEISHPAFTQVYRKTRSNTVGVTVTLEDSTVGVFDYFPMEITELKDSADLDTGIRINFGDLGEVLPRELDAVYAADQLDVRPVVIYRVYQSNDLTAPILGPLRLEVTTFSFTAEGASFEATAPYVNINRTGELYNLTRFNSLRSLVQ